MPTKLIQVDPILYLIQIIDDTNRLNLKITPYLQKPPLIEDYHVPIFTCTKEDIHKTAWDLTIEQVGVHSIYSITSSASTSC